MYDEIIKKLKMQLSSGDLELLKSKNIHLAIFTEPWLTYLLNGKKTIESRISKHKIAPYNKIEKDDIVFVKKSGGDILAYFTIKEILFIDLKDVNISEIKHKYNDRLCVDEKFWISKKDSKYATLIFINDLVKLQPFHINKKGMQTWIKLEK